MSKRSQCHCEAVLAHCWVWSVDRSKYGIVAVKAAEIGQTRTTNRHLLLSTLRTDSFDHNGTLGNTRTKLSFETREKAEGAEDTAGSSRRWLGRVSAQSRTMSSSSTWSSAAPLLLVAALWGCTNPLLNRASKVDTKPTQTSSSTDATSRSTARRNPFNRLLLDTWRLISNWQVSNTQLPLPPPTTPLPLLVSSLIPSCVVVRPCVSSWCRSWLTSWVLLCSSGC